MAQQRNTTSLAGRVSADLAHDYAQRAMRGAPTMTETEAQVLWALCGKITRAAQNAEHSAFMLLSEAQLQGQTAASGQDFKHFCSQGLTEAAEQMRAVKVLMSEGVEGLQKREGEAA